MSAVMADLAGYACDTSKCALPTCKCASPDPPVPNPPMFLLVTFDDSVQTELMDTVYALLNYKNPNSCSAKGTFFAQVYESNPLELQKWYARGMHG
jgi:hypothetical protein